MKKLGILTKNPFYAQIIKFYQLCAPPATARPTVGEIKFRNEFYMRT